MFNVECVPNGLDLTFAQSNAKNITTKTYDMYYNNPFDPFVPNKRQFEFELTEAGKTAWHMGENFFTSLLNESLKITDRIAEKTVKTLPDHDNAFDTCNFNSDSLVRDSISISNKTKIVDPFPPPSMKLSTAASTTIPSPTLNCTANFATLTSTLCSTGDTIMSPFGNTTQKDSGKEAIADIKVAQDRYAALKDLDDIFKSTVMSDGTYTNFY